MFLCLSPETAYSPISRPQKKCTFESLHKHDVDCIYFFPPSENFTLSCLVPWQLRQGQGSEALLARALTLIRGLARIVGVGPELYSCRRALSDEDIDVKI